MMQELENTSYYLTKLAEVHSMNNTDMLGELDVDATVHYGFLNTEFAKLEAQKEVFIENFHHTEKMSQAALERKWYVTEQGQRMIILKREIQTVEMILKAVKNHLVKLSIERRESR